MKSNRPSSLLFSAISLVAGFFLATLSSNIFAGRAPAAAHPGVTVQGVIYTQAGEPFAPARIELAAANEDGAPVFVDETGPAGQFAFRSIPSGDYILRAFPAGASQPFEWALVVGDVDIQRDFRALAQP